jgi:hypothetical protein
MKKSLVFVAGTLLIVSGIQVFNNDNCIGITVQNTEIQSIFGSCAKTVSPRTICFGGCSAGGCGCSANKTELNNDPFGNHPAAAEPCDTNNYCTTHQSTTGAPCSGDG